MLLFTVYDDQGVETTFNSLSGFNSFDTASLVKFIYAMNLLSIIT